MSPLIEAMTGTYADLPKQVAAVLQASVQPAHRLVLVDGEWKDNKDLPACHPQSYWRYHHG